METKSNNNKSKESTGSLEKNVKLDRLTISKNRQSIETLISELFASFATCWKQGNSCSSCSRVKECYDDALREFHGIFYSAIEDLQKAYLDDFPEYGTDHEN